MQITCTVQLDNDDSFAYTPDQAATQVLAALGGNPTVDGCSVHVSQSASGSAGTPPDPGPVEAP
jgi:hypothetical protein